jgi:hypothetical protein
MYSDSAHTEPDKDAQFDAVFAVLDRLEKEEVYVVYVCKWKQRMFVAQSRSSV